MDHQRSSLSGRRPLIAAISLCTLGVLAAGCGAGSSGSSGDSGSVEAQEPATDLTVTVTDGETTTWNLTCDPVGGDHPDAEAACAVLAGSGASAVPSPTGDQMCTQIFGGDQTATITGTWKGEKVDSSFSRKDGCEIARWDLLDPLLPKISSSRAS